MCGGVFLFVCGITPLIANLIDFFSIYKLFIILQTNFVMAALQAGSRGTQACINAASTVSGIIGDLDTTIMFASAGTLSAEPDGGAFGDHR